MLKVQETIENDMYNKQKVLPMRCDFFNYCCLVKPVFSKDVKEVKNYYFKSLLVVTKTHYCWYK